MRAGDLRHRISLQKDANAEADAKNEYGETEPSWETFNTVWASVEPLQGRELFNAQKVAADVTIRVRIRFLAGVGPQHRILYRGRILEIQSAIDVGERRTEMHLMCKEVV